MGHAWEICALQRVPPLDRRQRERLLRRNGIDQDLIAIISKALSPNLLTGIAMLANSRMI